MTLLKDLNNEIFKMMAVVEKAQTTKDIEALNSVINKLVGIILSREKHFDTTLDVLMKASIDLFNIAKNSEDKDAVMGIYKFGEALQDVLSGHQNGHKTNAELSGGEGCPDGSNNTPVNAPKKR